MKEDAPLVSVIMNCYNGSKYLRDAIDSVYAQTYKNWEIIFWDNASSDDSPQIVKSYDSRLKYFREDRTIPLYAARNCALKQARGGYIAFLDCDDVWLPQKLKEGILKFETSDRVGLVYSNVEILSEGGQARPWYSHNTQPEGMIFRHLLRHYHLVLPTVMISEQALNAVGGRFEDSLQVTGDAELFLRLAHDWEVAYIPEVTAQYREHHDSMTAKNPELFIVETEHILHQLRQRYPDFYEDYGAEILAFQVRVKKGLIFNLWRSGKNIEARRIAFQHLKNAFSMLVLYCLSFLPFRVLDYLQRINSFFSWNLIGGSICGVLRHSRQTQPRGNDPF